MPKLYIGDKLKCGIYKITSPSGNTYVGKSVNVYRRWDWYRSLHCKSQQRLYRSFKKYGVENHVFEIIEECSREMLNERETYFIKQLDTFDTPHGLNLHSGCTGGRPSEESCKKISTSLKARKEKYGKRVLSEETKRKIAIANTGRPGTMKNKNHKQESKDKISKKLMGNTHTLGTKQKQETIDKRAKSLMGKNKGKKYGPMSEHEKQKRREGGRLAWIKRKESEKYNSEESKQKRIEISRIGGRAMRAKEKQIIEQERLMMIF